MSLKKFGSRLLSLSVCATFLFLNSADASIVYSSATFNNFSILSDTPTGFSASANIIEGGVVAGTLTVTTVYGSGTNPFNSGALWGASNEFRFTGSSTDDEEEAEETAEATYSISISTNAGWSVDGLSLLSHATVLANPTFENLTSNGIATVADDNQGMPDELFLSHNDGDSFTNGDDLVFRPGSRSAGIDNLDHIRKWSYDSAGATTVSFNYIAGPVTNISSEGIGIDVALSFTAVPEPSTLCLLGPGMLLVMSRRKRNR